MQSIYLDNNSTTLIFDEVVEEMAACWRLGLANPASQHQAGRAARRVLEDARDEIGRLLGACNRAPQCDRVVFTSGGTEANNLAIRGLVQKKGNVVASSMEHPSVLEPAKRLKSEGLELRLLPITQSGHIPIGCLSEFINEDTNVVCVMMANNELGTIQPIKEVTEFCRPLGVPVHCDAVQAVGKMPIDFHALGVSTLTFSAHKFHGPRGIGGLLVRHDVQLHPFILGGSQQLGTRPGTETIAPVIGTRFALQKIMDFNSGDWADHVRPLRDSLETQILKETNAVVIGAEPRLPHATNIAFPGLDRQACVMALDLAGVECSTGSACTSGSSEPSHVVSATGVSDELVNSSLRFSLSMRTTQQEVELAVQRIINVVNNLRETQRNRWDAYGTR